MNPYQNLPEKAFWKPAVASKNMFDISDLWDPKFDLRPQHKVATFGSCFAQHIGTALKNHGFSWLDTEPAPFGLSPENCKTYGYNVFSCRTGNIYTTSLLKQWVEWALDKKIPGTECWQKNERFYDPFRPNIEPNGFESEEEMQISRQQTIKSFRQVIEQSNVFVFTLGLTESWFNKEHGYEYPMCPGTIAGEFDERNHIFKNQQFGFIIKNLSDAIEMMLGINKKLRFILTVSPVPLTATNSGNHVLVATMESKSILRAVAGQLATNKNYLDYFPSYEIINSTPFRGIFFDSNQRTVNPYGVNVVMDSFFHSLQTKFKHPPNKRKENQQDIIGKKRKRNKEEIICEEELLAAFGANK